MTEKEYEVFRKRFDAHKIPEVEVKITGWEAFFIAFFSSLFLLAFLKAWGFIW